jgi:acyl transferase domain-containing protein/NADPH:quinone reductase-like Zn-dependent oxidoreductase/short-subunit dehydrogenase/aryl carrier-like protein
VSDPRPTDHAALLKRSLQAIDQLQAKLAAVERERTEPIAIVGIGCRFPMGDTPAAFWEMLNNGIDAVTEVPPERWDVDAYYDPDPDKPGKSYTRWGAFIRDVDRFDPAFFGVSPREAVSMDPQQRVLLEVTWQALEHAAIAPSSLAGSNTAVYVGITTQDYAVQLAEAVGSRNGDAYTPSGTAHSVAGGRISYVLGLHGPNVAIDTACSSSLVALHWALASLRNRESDVAIAGGVNLTLTPDGSVLTSRARMMSFDGHCKTFDASADGYVRGEGCGMLVLKRLSDAQRDGDRVLALVRGSALNQDGRSSGLTAPNGLAQEAVIRAALANSRLKPADIGYVEAHGTGTPLGDPIEIKALNQVYGERPAGMPLQVGSVKTNIGHLEAAAGIAGVIKTVLALQHGVIPPHLHLKNPNPLIDWAGSAIAVPTRPTPWVVPQGSRRRAGISSFGFSGTNAHVILEEAPPAKAPPPAPAGAMPVTLSAQTPAALGELAGRLAQHLASSSGEQATDLAAFASTLALGRSHLVERIGFAAANVHEARARLEEIAREGADAPLPGIARGRSTGGANPEVVFMFTGQGAQHVGMARGLYEGEPVFRAALDECAAGLEKELPRPLLEVMFSDAEMLDDTAYTQPALFSVSYALTRLWAHWGVVPTAVLGHSVGEYVAACVAGVFTLPDALRLIAARGRLMSRLPREGGMAAVMAGELRVRGAMAGHEAGVSIAASNGPESLVIAGRHAALDAVLARLADQGVQVQRLKVSQAFHSPLMEPMLDEFERLVAAMPMAAPRIGIASNVSGAMADASICTAGYWRRHVREAVRFGESITTLRAEGYRVFLELGPAPTLTGMAQRMGPAGDATFVGSLRKGRDDRQAMLDAAMQLHVRGHRLDWTALLGEGAQARRVVLPGYPFQRQRYWQDLGDGRPARERAAASRRAGTHPLLGVRVPSPLPIFENVLDLASAPWLADHRIFDFTLFPGTGFLELALAAGHQALPDETLELGGLELREALALPDEGAVQLQVIATPQAGGGHLVQVHSRPAAAGDRNQDTPWRHHATCELRWAPAATPPARLDLPSLRERLAERIDVGAYYERLAGQGAHYGPTFRALAAIRRAGGELLGRAQWPDALPAQAGDAAAYGLHPALLDACFQLVGAGLEWARPQGATEAVEDLCVPVGLGAYRLHRAGVAAAWCHARVAPADANDGLFRADLTLHDDAGECVAELRGLELRRTSRAALQRVLGSASPKDWLFETTWVSHALPKPAEPPAAPGTWLLHGTQAGAGARIAATLRARGATVIEIHAPPNDAPEGHPAATAGRSFAGDRWTLDAARAEAWREALAEAQRRAGGRLAGVVLAGGLDQRVTTPERESVADIEAIAAAQTALVSSALAAAQALADADTRVWLLTRGSQAANGASDVAPDLAQAPLWAFGGVMAAELSAQKVVRIDLDADAPAAGRGADDEAAALVDHLLHPDAEDRIALRGNQRLVARLSPSKAEPRLPEAPLELTIPERGSLSNLRLAPVPRTAPRPGEVEIRVHATGLNFRDVLNALGMYPGDPGSLGNECAGVVSGVGLGVTEFAVGDEVVAMVDRSFATWAVAPAAMTVLKPREMEFASAATVPVTFLTALYALRDLAGIKPGDRVLIHAVTGGVGMAALQLALRAGAEVYGTAGTPAKRALARRLGAHHVGDSRSLSFADEFRRTSHGQGMDIVLNSLAGDFIPASLDLLKPGGHFVEIGKTGIWDQAKVAEAYPGRHYHPLYLGEIAAARPSHVKGMLQEVLADIGRGELQALPARCWPLEEAEAAFRFMGQGHHTGKIVITQSPAPLVRADASYIVTGGLGGLGLACAAGLADAGARHLTLLGRKAPGPAALQAIDALRARGVAVRVVSADVADAAALARVLDAGDQPPLRGVLHAAGSVDDGMLAELDIGRFGGVMAPKVRGTWNLHALTASRPLDFFVGFSSGASLLGSPGQANYAAANAFIDAMAHRRRQQGRHALSINWGSWSGAGMAEGVDASHRRRWATLGLSMIEPAEGVSMLMQLLQANRHAVAAALPLTRSRLPAGLPPFYTMLQATKKDAAAPQTAPSAADLVPRLHAANASERHALLQDFLAEQVVHVLALGAGHAVDRQRSLMDLGMDSLMAMELRNRVQGATRLRVAVADLLQGPTIASLAAELASQLGAGSLRDESGVAGAGREREAGQVQLDAPVWEEGTL